jgi:purine-cytosine permease-like protein
MSLTNRR